MTVDKTKAAPADATNGDGYPGTYRDALAVDTADEQWIARSVATAPPLTQEQVRNLRRLLRPRRSA